MSDEIRSAHSFEYSNDLRHLSMATEYALYLESVSRFDFRLMILFTWAKEAIEIGEDLRFQVNFAMREPIKMNGRLRSISDYSFKQ